MKPCYAHLGCQGCYIDDTYLQQQLLNDAFNSLNACKSLLTSLGLLIHPEKYLDIPSQIATVLRFTVNSLEMTAVAYGPLFYRDLEMVKLDVLKLKRGNYDSIMVLSDDMKSELKWWVDNLETAASPISNGNPDIVNDTDASLIGWGAVCNAG